jgi:hypothetical protein
MRARRNGKKSPTNKTCEQITALIYDYLNDRLGARVKSDFEQHLRLCPDCVNFLNTYRKTLVRSRTLPAIDLPAKVRSNILEFLGKRIVRSEAAP